MRKIKTRDVVKGTIKTIDKSVVLAHKTKQAYIQTKDTAEHSTHTEESTPEEYATNCVEEHVHNVAEKGVYYGNKLGYKAYKATRGNIAVGKAKIDVVRDNYRLKKQKQSISSTEYSSKDIKQMQKSLQKKSYKVSPKLTTVAESKKVKTATRTFKGSIKTSEELVRETKQVAKATATTMQKVRNVSKVVTQNAKRGIKATTKTIKAIIASTKALISAMIAGGWVAIIAILVMVLIGSALSIFGGGSSSNSYTSVSEQVEAYEPVIRKYAKEHAVSEYVELIKAVMMKESGGQGSDPMQSSECIYNTQYPKTLNGITNAEYSINVGVQYLANCLKEAETKNPVDMDNIKLTLQGYDYGLDYINWAKTKYGGYSVSNAIEYSNIKAQELGSNSYGDKQYATNVLRYYPFGRAFTSGVGQTIVDLALTQEGNVGGEPYWSWYGYEERVEWCACFVSWCANEVGLIEKELIPKFSGCIQGENWFKDKNQWLDKTYEPQPGTIIFFDWEQDGVTDHVGIVVRYEDNKVYTVEGNSNDQCKQNIYQYASDVIYGYGVPAY